MKLLGDLDKVRSRSEGKLPRTIKEAYSVTLNPEKSRSDETPEIHVFNFDNEQGFALMSGDERIPSLLALADSGSINRNDTIDNPGLAIFLDNTASYLAEIMPADPDAPAIYPGDETYKIHGPWETIVYCDPLCFVQWGQKAPYNYNCPTNDGQYYATGCVPTAVAQLMACYQFPDYNNITDFFHWPDMLMGTELGKKDISVLMSQLGQKQNLDVDYGIDESGAKIENINRTLKNYRYTYGGKVKDYDTNEMVSELSKKFPIIAAGFRIRNSNKVLGITINYSYKGGHAWLIHGLICRQRLVETYSVETRKPLSGRYEIYWYPLCNWGWDGNSNGYYLSGVFDTTNGPVIKDPISGTSTKNDKNYQFKQEMVTGIRK